jgi:alginate O-acetyltransferase complex protein AlgJ
VSRTKKKEYADPLAEIITYNKALEDKGITLYLMPVPPKALIYPDKLMDGVTPGGVEEERALYTEFYRLLNENGVKTIDLLPLLVEKSGTEDVYCKTDTHFSGKGLALFATEAAKVIKNQPWYSAVPKEDYSTKEQNVTIKGDLSQMLGVEVPEDVALSLVSVKASGEPVSSDEKSPVILMGDSHTLVFSAGGDLHAKGSGLFDQLSAELGFPLDLLGVRGSGVTPARINLFQRSKKDPQYLTGKKVLIWCFTAREFTGTGGWRSIPVSADK